MRGVRRMWRLDGGAIQINDLSLFSDTFGYQGERRQLVVSCYLIEHTNGMLLWDAGLPRHLLGVALTDAPKSARLERTLVEQLREIGIEANAIDRVAVSHYHMDHLGQVGDFAQATLMMGRLDYLALRDEATIPDTDPELIRPWLHGHRPVDLVSGDRDVYGDGTVRMLAMPGHTPGHYVLLVRLAGAGDVLLSGDTAVFAQQLADRAIAPANSDRAQSLASMSRLLEVSRQLNATLIVQHDADDVGKLPRFPLAASWRTGGVQC